jgi:hypothetical protein
MWICVLAFQRPGILLVVRVMGVSKVVGVYWYREWRPTSNRAIVGVRVIFYSLLLTTFLGRYLISNNYCSWLHSSVDTGTFVIWQRQNYTFLPSQISIPLWLFVTYGYEVSC